MIHGENSDLKSQYVFEFLKIVIKHLFTDLKKVAFGEEWIEVPFDWSIAGR
jgi:hypothetical protein